MLSKTDVAQILIKERRQLSSYILAVTRDVQSCDDLYQDVCLKALNTAEVFADADGLLRWSRVCARYTAIDALRKRQRGSVPLSNDILEVLAAEWPTHRQEECSRRIDALTRCLRQLSPYNRKLIELRYRQGLSGVEVAQHTKRKVKTVYQALTRIHKNLRNCVLQRLGGECPL